MISVAAHYEGDQLCNSNAGKLVKQPTKHFWENKLEFQLFTMSNFQLEITRHTKKQEIVTRKKVNRFWLQAIIALFKE